MYVCGAYKCYSRKLRKLSFIMLCRHITAYRDQQGKRIAIVELVYMFERLFPTEKAVKPNSTLQGHRAWD